MVAAAGLNVSGAFDFSYATDYPDEQTLARLLMAPAGIAMLVGPAREEAVRRKIVDALEPLRSPQGSYHLQNEFHYLVAAGPRGSGDAEPAPYDRNVIDQSTEFGARVARHLREEIVIWMTTVTPAGSPLPMPVSFLWDGAVSVVMYSRPGARVRNIEANPRVALNFHAAAVATSWSSRETLRSVIGRRLRIGPATIGRSTTNTSPASACRPRHSPSATACRCGFS